MVNTPFNAQNMTIAEAEAFDKSMEATFNEFRARMSVLGVARVRADANEEQFAKVVDDILQQSERLFGTAKTDELRGLLQSVGDEAYRHRDATAEMVSGFEQAYQEATRGIGMNMGSPNG